MAQWDPDAKLQDLTMELQLSDNDQGKAANRVFQEHLTLAAQSICHSAIYSDNEKVRLDAAKYVIDRNLGRIQDSQPTSNTGVWEEFLSGIVKSER